jgi:hypothetical protein
MTKELYLTLGALGVVAFLMLLLLIVLFILVAEWGKCVSARIKLGSHVRESVAHECSEAVAYQQSFKRLKKLIFAAFLISVFLVFAFWGLSICTEQLRRAKKQQGACLAPGLPLQCSIEVSSARNLGTSNAGSRAKTRSDG